MFKKTYIFLVPGKKKYINTFNIFHIRYKKFYKQMDQIRNS